MNTFKGVHVTRGRLLNNSYLTKQRPQTEVCAYRACFLKLDLELSAPDSMSSSQESTENSSLESPLKKRQKCQEYAVTIPTVGVLSSVYLFSYWVGGNFKVSI